MTKPSQVTDDYWVTAEAPDAAAAKYNPWVVASGNGRYPTLHEVLGNPEAFITKGGKWQIFLPRAEIDESWAKVAHLVQAGELGPSAKVSTAKKNPNSSHGANTHVIIVYAADWRDVADLRRILQALRRAGIARSYVHFKRDRESISGKYVNRGNRGVSVWNSGADGDEFSTKWPSGNPVTVTDENAGEIVAAIERQDAANRKAGLSRK